MRAQEPDAGAARALFTELEFTTLVQDFLSESVELGETDYRDAQDCRRGRSGSRARTTTRCGMLAIALEARRRNRLLPRKRKAPTKQDNEQLSLSAAAAGYRLHLQVCASQSRPRPARR